MKACRVIVDLIPFISITTCNITKQMNQHGRAHIVGVIQDQDEEKCLRIATSDSYVKIIALNEENSKEVIFVGVVEKLEIESASCKKVHLDLVTGTRQIDLQERTRTFQNIGATYETILQSNAGLNSSVDAAVLFECKNEAIGHLISQYKETDWEFAIRMGSNMNSFVYPAFCEEGSKYYVGLVKHDVSNKPDDITNYSIKREVDSYEKRKKRNVALMQDDMCCYTFKSREILEIGNSIPLQEGKSLYVYKIETYMEGAELVHIYEMRTENGFLVETKYNMKMVGASLSGAVKSVSRDQVEIDLETDAPYSDTGSKLFPYSTVYSSPDGTGWYCMPEIGDKVRLYFPTEKEKHAYIISSVHLEVTDSSPAQTSNDIAPRTDPSIKSIKNATGKEVRFEPTRLSIINPDSSSIILDDEYGVMIASSKKISINAVGDIDITSMNGNIDVEAKNALAFKQDTTRILMNKNITFKAAQVKLQEKE